MKSRLTVLVLCVVFLAATRALAIESSYTEIGFLPGYETSNFPTSMTDDGRTVVGWTMNPDSARVPYIWRRSSGIAPLASIVNAAADDLLISGDGDSIFLGQGTNVARWTQESGLAPLFSAPSGSYAVQLSGSSTNGQAVTGLFYADGAPGEPAVVTSFLWRQDTGITTFSDGFVARGISPDGNYLVGHRSVGPDGVMHDVIRRGVDGGETIVETGYSWADATAASADGSVVIGVSTPEGFRWNDQGSASIGKFPVQGDPTSPLDVSHDGSVVVGYAEGAPQGAFIWDPSHGLRSIHQLLLDDNVDVSNLTFSAARFVSADGRTIVGGALGGSGGQSAWVATVVPEPSTLVLTVVAVPVLLFGAGKRRKLAAR
jgi:uncharacterized membrane protein